MVRREKPLGPNEVKIFHPETDGQMRTTRKAFDKVWSDKGWEIEDEGSTSPPTPPAEPEEPEQDDDDLDGKE